MTNSEKRPCSLCGNVYDKAFTIVLDDNQYLFDCFECAIQLLAPTCAHCTCRIIGHGLEADGVMYCCVHCAEKKGEERLRDRA